MAAHELLGLLIVLMGTGTVFGVQALLTHDWLMERLHRRRSSPFFRKLRIPWTAACAALAGCIAYAHWIEPFRFEVTHHEVRAPSLPEGYRLRILHLTDLHLESNGAAVDWILETMRREKPDVIAMTGDYVNNMTAGWEAFTRLAEQLDAPFGVLAVIGNYDSRDPFEACSRIVTLHGFTRSLNIRGKNINFCGRSFAPGSSTVQRLSSIPPADYTVMLYHTPELIDVAAENNVDLFLCGHTHGGQVRLPFYGAVVTLSDTGKKYEAGMYNVGKMTAYVGRGIGNEGDAPRLRFLCRPEITVFDVVGTGR